MQFKELDIFKERTGNLEDISQEIPKMQHKEIKSRKL